MPPARSAPAGSCSAFDRRLGGRFVAGADEAGRGPLAGPLVVAGVLLDYECLRDHRVRPLALLNDSKQVDAGDAGGALPRGARVRRAHLGARVPAGGDRPRRAPPVEPARAARGAAGRASRPTSALVDGFKLGPTAPPHRAVVDGDTKSAAIAAASIVAKVTRDRYMRTADALYPGVRLRVARRATSRPAHTAIVRERGPVRDPPPFVACACYLSEEELAAASG